MGNKIRPMYKTREEPVTLFCRNINNARTKLCCTSPEQLKQLLQIMLIHTKVESILP